MKILKFNLSFLILLTLGLGSCAQNPEKLVSETDQKPPFSGTIFVNPDILTPSDPTALLGISSKGQDSCKMYDRRVNTSVTVKAYLFEASYDDELTAEIQVNPEFGSFDKAHEIATTYAKVIGHLPTVLRKDVKTVSIHKGNKPFGGGNQGLLIHTGMGERYIKDGILEETLVHEASHTSLDADYARKSDWLEAQKADGKFISSYAKDHPFREDIAESFLLYIAIRYRSGRIPDSLKKTIVEIMPNRIQYFDDQRFDMHPVE